MSSRLQAVGLAAAAIGVATIYVLVHESRRKRKKAEREKREKPISKELLLKILNKSAEASKAVIERIRVEVRKIKVARNLSDETAAQLFQQHFEHSLDQLIGAIRNQFHVAEKAMDSSFKLHQSDPEVQAAIQNMRMLSSATPPAASSSSSSGQGASQNSAPLTGAIPGDLTRARLKEIMQFNADMLEKLLKPIKDEVAKCRRQGKQPQVDQTMLMNVQMTISSEVTKRFGVDDEQVMAAVEHFGAKDDPAFKEILQKIANTLNSSLA